jgi:hypothetical protein
MRINISFRGFSLLVLFCALAGFSYADDALVLPKGTFRFTLDANNYLPVDTRYGPTGKVENVAVDYNRNLNSNAFPALAPLDPFVPGLPSIGDSVVSFKYHFNILETGIQYGVTDSLTVGVRIPYWWVKNSVKATVNTSSANVGKNPFFACGAALCPLFVPGTVPVNTEDVRNLLGKGLDVNGDGVVDVPGFGFKRFQSFSANGLSDVEAGFRYQYLKTDDWRMAFTGGIRFPTGRVDDIDNLTDYAFGQGAYALLFRFGQDYMVSNLWKGPQKPVVGEFLVPDVGDLVINGTFRYDLVLPDSQTLRVPDNVNNPITANKEVVKRNLGDLFEFEISGKYGLLVEGLNFSALYKYGYKLQDQISGKLNPAVYHSLEAETRRSEQIYIIGLSYSTVPLYVQKKFSFPFTVSVSYRNRFAGNNNYLRSQFISFGLQFFY